MNKEDLEERKVNALEGIRFSLQLMTIMLSSIAGTAIAMWFLG